MAQPSIYDIENLRLVREGLSPLVNLSAQQAALAQQQYLRQQAIAEEAARTFRTQQFQRTLQQEQIAGYGKNQKELEAARDKNRDDKEEKLRTIGAESLKAAIRSAKAASSNVDRLMLQYQDAQEAALRKDAAALLGIKPEQLTPLSNPKHRQAIEDARMTAGGKPQGPEATGLYLKVQEAIQTRQDTSRKATGLYDNAIQLGIPIPEDVTSELSATAIADPFALPKSKPSTEISKGGNVETPPEFNTPGIVPKARDWLGNIIGGIELGTRGARVRAGNALANIFSGKGLNTPAQYSPEERAIMENDARFIREQGLGGSLVPWQADPIVPPVNPFQMGVTPSRGQMMGAPMEFQPVPRVSPQDPAGLDALFRQYELLPYIAPGMLRR